MDEIGLFDGITGMNGKVGMKFFFFSFWYVHLQTKGGGRRGRGRGREGRRRAGATRRTEEPHACWWHSG